MREKGGRDVPHTHRPPLFEVTMPKRVKEPSAYPRINNHQKFSAMRLIPVINQKNYFTNYLKKDTQYLGRKIRERPENDESRVVVVQLGSRNLKVGFADEAQPKTLPFCLAKPQGYYGEEDAHEDTDLYEDGLADVKQSFVDRLKFYKTRIVPNAAQICTDFNSRQEGTAVIDQDSKVKVEGSDKIYCQETDIPATHNLFRPVIRGVLNEDPHYYRSAQEMLSDISGILSHAMTSSQGLDIKDMNSQKYDVIIVAPDLLSRRALALFVDLLFGIGFANVAIIQEAVAASYGAGISTACVIDVGAETTSVSCVDDGACIADSRVKLDFGGDDITKAFGKLLSQIKFPGNPDEHTLEKLKEKFMTVNEADISVQLYQYYLGGRKYDFKVYNEVMLPVLGLFYPDLFTIVPKLPWRFSLLPRSMDPYSSHTNEPISDADINIRMNTLAVMGQSYLDKPTGSAETAAVVAAAAAADEDDPDTSVMDAEDADDGEISRDGTPAADASGKNDGKEKTEKSAKLLQINAFESLDPTSTAVAALDLAIIESIKQAEKLSGTPKQYYENLLVIGGGAKIPGFHALLTDRLLMWNQSRLKELGEVGVMAMPRDMDPEFLSWRGGCVYSNLKVIDEMWTTSHEWEVLGPRALHYKAALYIL